MTNAFAGPGLFGSLFSDPSVASEFGAPAFTSRMLAFEAAWTQALGDCGIVPARDAALALAAIKAFSASDFAQGSMRDGLPVPMLVQALKKDLPKEAATAIHTGATSQDVMDTATVMTCLGVMDTFKTRIARILTQLDGVLDRWGANPLVARTRMQMALPATVTLRVDAWRRPLADHLMRAKTVCDDLSVVQIGGPIGARHTPHEQVKTCAETVAGNLGLALVPVWQTDRSRIVGFGHWMTLVTGSLGKIGQDIALMAQQGVDEVSLSSVGGSSAMAHKKNPVLAETMVTLARYVAGQQGILAQAMIHEQERSGTAWALEWLTLPAMAEATGASLYHAEKLISSIKRIGAPDAS